MYMFFYIIDVHVFLLDRERLVSDHVYVSIFVLKIDAVVRLDRFHAFIPHDKENSIRIIFLYNIARAYVGLMCKPTF